MPTREEIKKKKKEEDRLDKAENARERAGLKPGVSGTTTLISPTGQVETKAQELERKKRQQLVDNPIGGAVPIVPKARGLGESFLQGNQSEPETPIPLQAQEERTPFLQQEIPTSPLGALGFDQTPIPERFGGEADTTTIPEAALSVLGAATGGLAGVAGKTLSIGGEILGVSEKAVATGALTKAGRGTVSSMIKKAVPFAAGLAGFRLSQILDRPSKRIEEIKTGTTTTGELISNLQTGLKTGGDDYAEYVYDQIDILDDFYDDSEQQIKQLQIRSVKERTNPEKSNDAVIEINKMRNKLFLLKQAALRNSFGNSELDPEGFALWIEANGGVDLPPTLDLEK